METKDIIDLKYLKRAIEMAEKELAKLKEDNRREFKQKRITRALEKAYALLNLSEYTQKEVDKNTRRVIRSLQDGFIPIFWYYILFGFLLVALGFTAYETYSYISVNWDREHELEHHYINQNLSGLVTINFDDTNIVDLRNQFPLPRAEGLKHTPQTFYITNDSSKLPTRKINYYVGYNVNISEMNSGASKVLNKRYINYRVTWQEQGGRRKVEEGNFASLPRNPDGTYLLVSDVQAKDSRTDFSVVLWLDEHAGNSEQGASYTFAFKLAAVIGKR